MTYCHIIQHAHFETPGVILPWLEKKGFLCKITHPYQGQALPIVAKGEPVILMGGPQSAREYPAFDYLELEVQWIKQLIQQAHPLLGICLGAQLIAESLGAKTERSPEKEVGIFPIHLTQNGIAHPLLKGLPSSIDVTHWHYDMPGLTQQAQVLAFSDGCPRQIIAFSPKVIGLQCHLEMTRELMAGLIEHASDDLKPSRFTQSHTALLNADFTQMNQTLFTLLNRWLEIS